MLNVVTQCGIFSLFTIQRDGATRIKSEPVDMIGGAGEAEGGEYPRLSPQRSLDGSNIRALLASPPRSRNDPLRTRLCPGAGPGGVKKERGATSTRTAQGYEEGFEGDNSNGAQEEMTNEDDDLECN